MAELRDYERWHERYDDPRSGLSWRLQRVQSYIERFLDERDGPLRVLSVCSGDGRDLLQVLGRRQDTRRIAATLLELNPVLAGRASEMAASLAPDADIAVRVEDAGDTDAYVGAVPADLVLLVGVLGNIGDADVEALIAGAGRFCRPGALLVWSRGRDRDDINDLVRGWFAGSDFTELEYDALDLGSRPALGVVRFDGAAVPLVPGEHLFTFWR